jgi:hypothetical protein
MVKRRAVEIEKAMLKGAWKNKTTATKAEIDANVKVKV